MNGRGFQGEGRVRSCYIHFEGCRGLAGDEGLEEGGGRDVTGMGRW